MSKYADSHSGWKENFVRKQTSGAKASGSSTLLLRFWQANSSLDERSPTAGLAAGIGERESAAR